jgi:hypothetical protein
MNTSYEAVPPFTIKGDCVFDADGARVIVCSEERHCPRFYKESAVNADGHFICPECGRLGLRMVELRMSAPQDNLFPMDEPAIMTVRPSDIPCRSRRLSPKQSAIMDVVNKRGGITLEEATALVGRNVYHNAKKHTGALLANMVNLGMLAREKAGVFIQPNKDFTSTLPRQDAGKPPVLPSSRNRDASSSAGGNL